MGLSPCSLSLFGPVSFFPSWLDGVAARELGCLCSFFLFLWGRRLSKDAGMGLPVGLFLFQLEGLPCLRSGGRGQWMQSLAGRSVLRDGYLVPFRDSLPLLRSPVLFTTLRVCLPRAPALRQVLEAMLADGALESPSVLVPAFQSSLPRGEVVCWVSVL